MSAVRSAVLAVVVICCGAGSAQAQQITSVRHENGRVTVQGTAPGIRGAYIGISFVTPSGQEIDVDVGSRVRGNFTRTFIRPLSAATATTVIASLWESKTKCNECRWCLYGRGYHMEGRLARAEIAVPSIRDRFR